MLGAAGTGAWLAIAADGDELMRANATAGGAAALLLATGLALRIALAIPLAVALLGAEYVALLGIEGAELDARAPSWPARCSASPSSATGRWSSAAPSPTKPAPTCAASRLLAALLLGTIGAGVVLLAVVEVVSAGGAVVDLLGALAASRHSFSSRSQPGAARPREDRETG